MLARTVFVLSALLAGGCLKTVPVQRLDQPTPIRVALLRDDVHERKVGAVPALLRQAVGGVLEERNLQGVFVEGEALVGGFGGLRDSGSRLAHLRTLGEGGVGEPAKLILLVETKAVFYSQLSGRYRWTIYVKLTAAEVGSGRDPLTDSFDLPVVLTYAHQREPEALAAASQGITRRLASLLDDFLAGRAGTPATPGKAPGAADKGASRAPPADPGSIYFVMLDRFANGDRANDGRVAPDDPAGWHGGDLRGVIERLDYLQGLGVETVWLSPIFASRQEKFHGHGAFHGYWTVDPTRVEPRFGTAADLQELAEGLHARGMKLVLDLVVNHVGYDAPLLAEHPDWFHRQGTITDWQDPDQVVRHDVHGLPDLAQENPEVFAWLLTAARRWLAETGADGFRLDAVKHVGLDFWARFNAALAKARPGLILLGEHYDGDPRQVTRIQRQGGFSHMFDFPLAFALKDVFCDGQPPGKIAAVLSNDRLYPDPRRLVTFLDNHDLPRIRTSCGGDAQRVMQALTAQFGLRGVPALNYGTEAGLMGAGEPENRGDMVFDDPAMRPLKDHVTRLLGLRRAEPALRQGTTRILELRPTALVIARALADRAVLLVINTGQRASVHALAFDSETVEARDLLTGRGVEGEYRVAGGQSRLIGLQARTEGGLTDWTAPYQGARQVRFRVAADGLAEDEQLKLVGSGPELGGWDPAAGLGPLARRSGGFEARMRLPVGLVFAYKLVAVGPEGRTRWEKRDDRYLFVTAGAGPMDVELSFGQV